MSQAAPKPQTDTTLAALAVLERFSTEDFDSVDALMSTTDARELVIGLLDVSRMLASMLAKATDGQPDQVFVHVRQTVLGLIQEGHLSTDLAPIATQ